MLFLRAPLSLERERVLGSSWVLRCIAEFSKQCLNQGRRKELATLRFLVIEGLLVRRKLHILAVLSNFGGCSCLRFLRFGMDFSWMVKLSLLK